jgi:nucleotide-binding universal stress UspA family protein
MLRILVAVDGSELSKRAARFAADLAQRIGESEVLLLNAQEPVDESQTHGLEQEAIRKHREQYASASCADARATVERAGVRCVFEWRFGDPAEVIIDVAREREPSLIVMGTHGEGALENLLVGSVGSKVLHSTQIPVAFVP